MAGNTGYTKGYLSTVENEEMMLVLQGTMRFLHGGQEYLVEAGDCVYFDSSIPHYGLPVDHQDVKCVMVIYVP